MSGQAATPSQSLTFALERSQMTREDFARKILGVDPSTVYRWLHGRPIPLTVQDRLAYYLNTEATPDTLEP